MEDVQGLLAPPPDLKMGDLAFPCFRLKKVLGNVPPKIAAELAGKIGEAAGEDGIIAEATTAGPYVNLRVRLAGAAQALLPTLAAGIPKPTPTRDAKVMVEYSQPNTHKAFHVGHMRNVCLGDAIVRVLRADGYDVVAANYLGDVGAHIAKCLWWYLDHLSDDQRVPPDHNRGEWLGEFYSAASNQLSDWEDAAKAGDSAATEKLAAAKARTTEILSKLESRDPELTKIWDQTRKWSLEDFEEIYDWTGVAFDRVYYESEVDEPAHQIVDEYLDKGVFIHSEGSVGIMNDEIKHMPYFMLRKSDGTSLYSTKDLALARLKFDEHNVDRSIYVVDVRQSDHFKHVFATLKKMGFDQADQCHHVPYEMVELPSGAMSTRKGTVILFRALRERMTTFVADNYLAKYRGEWSDEEIATTARTIALGAIKYGMLNRDVNQKIVFDLEAWLNLEGDTGPYLQYVAARIRSILRKSAAEGKALDPDVLNNPSAHADAFAALKEPEEQQLVMALDGLGPAIHKAAEQLRPHGVCTYLFNLAKTYNRFQIACNVKASEGPLLQGRLLLVQATLEAMVFGLGCLGIPAPERM